MKSLHDFNEYTTPQELFVHFYDQIINRKISTFAQLMGYAAYLPKTMITEAVYRKAFRLIKELNWGVFSPLSPKEYPELWKELVLPFQGMSGVGDLKRNTSISSVYTALLDIHGYTSFCQKHRRNLSMLQLLDDCLQQDIRKICHKYGTLSWRTVGDTIALVSADAKSITAACLGVTDYFSRRKVIKSDKLGEDRLGNKIILPDMTVSAGITGGRNYTPMVITQDGDISGDIINTASRLQNFANILDPEKTRILLTNHVAHQLQKKDQRIKEDLLQGIDYFDLGPYQFKGMDIRVFEVLYKEDQKRKLKYQDKLNLLYDALAAGKWRDNIFTLIVSIISEAVSVCDPTSTNKKTAEELLKLCKAAIELYNSGVNYRKSVGILEELCVHLPLFKDIDPIVPIRAEQILENYKHIEKKFQERLENAFPELINKFLDISQRDLFLKSRKNKEIYDKIKAIGMKEMQKENQKYAWFQIIDENLEALNDKIYIGKK